MGLFVMKPRSVLVKIQSCFYIVLFLSTGVLAKHADEPFIQASTTVANSNLEDVEHKKNLTVAEKRDYEFCPSQLECSKLGGECINCKLNYTCVYGESLIVQCEPKKSIKCEGHTLFNRSMVCRYCYQTDPWEHICQPVNSYSSCKVVSYPRERFLSNCTVKSDVICLGKRHFPKNQTCNWTAGYKWTTALALSVTLGGFGADRFYLGHWQEGIGKLFSFGGLGVWTLIDVILIAIGYLGPADGSLYIR